ncbi:unnamed protein product, partial [Polarella glacialis]
LDGRVVGIDNVLGGKADSGSTDRERLQVALERVLAINGGLRYSNEALAEARARCAASDDQERRAFEAAVAEWRQGTGPVTIERDPGVITRPAAGSSAH